jgi:Flp pilus assembly protein TadG
MRLFLALKRRLQRDDGTAIIEFIFVAVIILVPLVYFLTAVAAVQRSQLAVTQAARNAGRAFATSDTSAEANARARAAVRLALADQGLPDDATLRFVRAGASCGAPAVNPQLAPGAEFAVCVVRHAALPWVPKPLTGDGIISTGVYVVHVDDFRSLNR